MEQFKDSLDNFVMGIKQDLIDNEIDLTREVLMGLLIQYMENMIDNSMDQSNFEDGLWQKTTNYSVENTELLIERTHQIAALACMLKKEFENA